MQELSALRHGHKIDKNIRKFLWQALEKHTDSSLCFPSETLCFSSSVLKSEHLCLPSVTASAAPHQTQGSLAAAPCQGSAGSLSMRSCDNHGSGWLPHSKGSVPQLSAPSILGLSSACCFYGMPSPFIGKGVFTPQ